MPRRLIRVEGGGEERTVRLRLEFNPNGTLATPPVVLNPKSSKDFLMLAESTIRATMACQPFKLPAKKYAIWKTVIMNFNASNMFEDTSNKTR
jgi:hypothetical protein